MSANAIVTIVAMARMAATVARRLRHCGASSVPALDSRRTNVHVSGP